MRLIQHKREAYWFYRFLSLGYDRWVNPLFWTPAMRARALEEARLEPGLKVLDAGAGTGFTTEGIVARVDAADVTMLDQSPHQLARSRAKPALADCPRVLGDAESAAVRRRHASTATSPRARSSTGRTRSAGIAEAYRVTRAGGTALMIGPVRPANRVARALAEAWMLFPPVEDYTGWMEAAGFTDVRVARAGAGLVPRPARAVRARGQRRQARAGAVAGAAARPPAEEPPASRAEVRRALRGRLGGGRRVRPDRGRADAPRPRCAASARAALPPRRRAAPARLRGAPRRRAARRRPRRARTPRSSCGGSRGRTRSSARRCRSSGSTRSPRPSPSARRRRTTCSATLVAGLTVNIAIVGVNQITDVEIDRINKPWLPIAAGDLSLGGGAHDRRRVHGRSRSRWRSRRAPSETAAVAAGLAVGALYSLPPFRLKRFPVAASLCITGVRSVVVNLGVYWHFAGEIAPPVWALCLFVLPFSFAIAVLKDVPDIEGDRRFSIRTFTVRLGRRARVPDRVWRRWSIAYGGMIVLGRCCSRDYANPVVLIGRPPCRRDAALVLGAERESPRSRAGSRASTCGSGHSSSWSICWCPLACLALIRTSGREQTGHGWPERRGQASTRRGRFVGNVDCL